MSAERILDRIARDSAEELAEYIGKDLDVPSPFMGATGPPDRPGPEQDYAAAISRLALADQASLGKIGRSLWLLLSQENGALAHSTRVARPFLLFNLCELLQTVKVPPTEELLRALRRFKGPLVEALSQRAENLYARLLMANAVNQDARADLPFWLEMLNSGDLIEVNAGIIGLRESGVEHACHYLPQVEQAYRRHPELGSFEDEVMLLIDTYPTRNWPDCAAEFIPSANGSRIPELIEKHSRERYVPDLAELRAIPGGALDIVQKAQKTSDVAQQRKKWNGGNPATLLSAGRSRSHNGSPRELLAAIPD